MTEAEGDQIASRAAAPLKAVAQHFTGAQFADLVKALLPSSHSDALSVLQHGIVKGACGPEVFELLYSIAVSGSKPDASKAVEIMRLLATQHDLSGTMAVHFGMSLVQLAQLSAADGTLARSLLEEAGDVLEQVAATHGTPELWYIRALVCFGRRCAGSLAQQSLDKCLEASGGRHGGALLLLASLKSAQGNAEEAERVLQAALELEGASGWRPWLWLALARLQGVRGHHSAAQVSLGKAIGSAPQSQPFSEAWYELGLMYISQNRMTDAQACAEALAAEVQSGARPVWRALLEATLLWRQGQHGRAVSAVEEALYDHQHHSHLYLLKGRVHADAEGAVYDLPLAHVNLRAAAEAMPDNAATLEAYAKVCVALRQTQEGAQVHLRAAEASRKPALVHWHTLPIDGPSVGL